MSKRDPEEVIYDLSWKRQQESGRIPGDAELRAYREGHLEGAARREIEALLARSGDARRRLRELAQVAAPEPSARVRRRILEGFDRGGRSSWRARRRLWTPALAAAAIIVVGFFMAIRRHATGRTYGLLFLGTALTLVAWVVILNQAVINNLLIELT